MRRALLAAAALALLAVPSAQANGDPASDVLITQQVFIGAEVPVPQSEQDVLTKTVAAANEKGYTIRVAVIVFTGDLGTAVSLWKHPQSYAKFLGSELAFVGYTNRLLVAMPSGYGVYHRNKPVLKERAVLAKQPVGKTPTALVQSTTEAVRALAAADGVQVPAYTSKSTTTRDRLIIVAAGLGILLLVAISGWRRVRARGGERSPSAEPRSSPRRSPGSSDPGTGGQSQTPP
jgi:hypothetical protein